jgi:hypothetical protein
MSFSNEQVDSTADGGIFNFYAELPSWMEHEDVSMALLELDASVRGIQDPPVATIFSDSPQPEHVNIEDYRRFYVEFESGATTDDMIAALRFTTDAIKKFRYQK